VSLIAQFLTQEATWEKLTGRNSYTGNTYDDPETINVRWYTETERVDASAGVADQGVRHVSTTHISTQTEVSVGDRITDENGVARFVEAVRKNRAANGTFSHYVATLQ